MPKAITILDKIKFTLTVDDGGELWRGKIHTPSAWAQYKGSPKGKPPASIDLQILPWNDERPDDKRLVAQLKHFFDNQQANHDISVDLLIRYCQFIKRNAKQPYPDVTTPQDLQSLLAPKTLWIGLTYERSNPFVCLVLEGDWEKDAGIAITYQTGKITGINPCGDVPVEPNPTILKQLPPASSAKSKTSPSAKKAPAKRPKPVAQKADAFNDKARYTLLLNKPLDLQHPTLAPVLALYRPNLADDNTRITNLLGIEARVFEKILTDAKYHVDFHLTCPGYPLKDVKRLLPDCPDLHEVAQLMMIARANTFGANDTSLEKIATQDRQWEPNWRIAQIVRAIYPSSKNS